MKFFLKSGVPILLLLAVSIQAATTVTNIAAGDSHSLFIKSDGSLWAMGNNYSGQLGDGTFNNTNRPEEIISSNVIAVASGGGRLFLKTNGSLWGMGWNCLDPVH
jgi:alpha-tubulin suppressor-like RCC1 family protein